MREFDIIVWGATGFVGRLVAKQLFSLYHASGLHWALGGRNQTRVESVRAELGSAAADIPIVTGDSHDVASLEALVARTKVVCTTVGPYEKHGSDLVKACVCSGTHYCDVTGEVHWMRKMIDAHQAEAEQTGARIVHTCGFDSIPSDMGVFFLQRKAKQLHGQPCSHIRMRVKAIRGGFSGGTRASMIHGMREGVRDPSIKRVMKEPYSLNPEGQRQGPDAPERMMAVRYDGDLKAWTMPFFMSPVNTKVVRRSNALLGYPYGKDFRYEEAMLLGSGLVSWAALLRKLVFPGSGQGPSRSVREKGYFDLILVGKLADGDIMRTRVKGAGDPGTGSTSKMLVDSAVCLAQDSDSIEVGGGFWTPASAMGKLLLSRLTANAGLSFEIES